MPIYQFHLNHLLGLELIWLYQHYLLLLFQLSHLLLQDLEIFKVTDPEPKVSVPDVDVTGKDLGGYRYLVGAKNLLLTKKFLELAKDNKSIPANVVQAYIPAIATIDNIVKAGPGFVQMLRTLENRAKKHPKS